MTRFGGSHKLANEFSAPLNMGKASFICSWNYFIPMTIGIQLWLAFRLLNIILEWRTFLGRVVSIYAERTVWDKETLDIPG